MSISRCVLESTTRLVFLEIICDTEVCRFEVPRQVAQARDNPHGSNCKRVNFLRGPRALGRKCTSMSFAVSPANLYMYHMDKHIAKFRHTGRVKAAMTAVQKGRSLWDEFLHMADSAPPCERGISARCHALFPHSSSQEPRTPYQADEADSSGDFLGILMSSRQPQFSRQNG